MPLAEAPLTRPPQSLGVIRLWAIGESLLALPAIQALKTQWPGAKITVVTTPRAVDVFRGQAFIDEVVVLRPNLHLRSVHWVFQHRKKFDIAIDFEPYFYVSAFLARMIGKYSLGFDTLTRGKLYTKAVPYQDDQHVVKTNFDLVRAVEVEEEVPMNLIAVAGDPTTPRLRGAPRAGTKAGLPAEALAKAGPATHLTIALAPGGGVDFRRWPVERFAQVADYLVGKHGCEIVLVGDEADEPILRDVQKKMKNSARIVSDLSLPEVAELLSQCRLTIANDGGLMHVSAAMVAPTLGLFGPETPVRLGPYGPKNQALYHQLEDNPIINVSRGEVPGMLRISGDPSRYVRAITVEEVLATADKMLRTEEETMSETISKTSLIEMARIS